MSYFTFVAHLAPMGLAGSLDDPKEKWLIGFGD